MGRRLGDHGQKVWTSGAHYSDYGIVITRTDPNVPKHVGEHLIEVGAPDICLIGGPAPGVSSTENMVRPACLGTLGSVRVMTMP